MIWCWPKEYPAWPLLFAAADTFTGFMLAHSSYDLFSEGRLPVGDIRGEVLVSLTTWVFIRTGASCFLSVGRQELIRQELFTRRTAWVAIPFALYVLVCTSLNFGAVWGQKYLLGDLPLSGMCLVALTAWCSTLLNAHLTLGLVLNTIHDRLNHAGRDRKSMKPLRPLKKTADNDAIDTALFTETAQRQALKRLNPSQDHTPATERKTDDDQQQ